MINAGRHIASTSPLPKPTADKQRTRTIQKMLEGCRLLVLAFRPKPTMLLALPSTIHKGAAEQLLLDIAQWKQAGYRVQLHTVLPKNSDAANCLLADDGEKAECQKCPKTQLTSGEGSLHALCFCRQLLLQID